MSMQINLQHVFKMSASRTRACIGTTLAYISDVQRDRHGVRRSFKIRLHRVVFCRAGGENKLCLLPRRAADVEVIARYYAYIREWVRVSAGQCSSHRAREKIELLRRETPDFISPEQWPPNSPHLNPVDYKIWATVQIKIRNIDELRWCLQNVWSTTDVIDAIDASIDRETDILNTCCKFNCIDTRTSR